MGWLDQTCWQTSYDKARWRWPEGWDFAHDGRFTVGDLGQAIGWIFHAPGDAVIAAMRDTDSVRRFLELDCKDYAGVVSTGISAVVWFVAVLAVGKLAEGVAMLFRPPPGAA